jgi:uncharacterized membrane protein
VYQHTPHHWIRQRQNQGPVKVHDQLPTGHPVTRFNSKLAVLITKVVGTMWCAYFFAAFDLVALPQSIKGGLFGIVQWVASFFLQLVLLSIIMVGQNIQANAADKRSEQTYRDAEAVLAEALKIQEHLAAQDALLAKLVSSVLPPDPH